MRLLEDSLAEEILSGRVKSGDVAIIDINDDGQVQVTQGEKRELLPQAAD